MAYISLVKAVYDYVRQSDDELSLTEDSLYFVLDNSDPDWSKVRLKSDTDDEPSGLVPAAYVEEVEPISSAKALYDYDANGDGELSIKEDEALNVFEKDDEWWLVKSTVSGGKLGLVPGNYVEEIGSASSSSVPEPVPAPTARPTSVYVDPEERVAASHDKAKADDIRTWAVTEIDKKGKKKKGTLGVGNGAIFFASESDKTPVQQWPTTSVTISDADKPKHVVLEIGGASPTTLHFNAGSKENAEAILAKLESSQNFARPSHDPSPSPTPESVPLPSETSFKGPKLKKSVNFSSSPAEVIQVPDPESEDENPEDENLVTGVVLYDFTADGDDELAVSAGETITVIDREGSDDWWKCRNAHGAEGVVPALYIEVQVEDTSNDAASQAAVRAQHEEEERHKAAEKLELERVEQARQKEAADRAKAVAAEHTRKKIADQKAAEAARLEREAARAREAEARPRPQSGSPKPRPESTSRAAGAPSKELTRVWHDRTGQFRVEAEYLGMKDGKLRLHKVNGVVIEVPMEKMSPADITFIQSMDKDKKTSQRATSPDEDAVPLAKLPAMANRPSVSQPRPAPRATSSPIKRPATDWFEFFLSAGCDVDDCTRYTAAFERDKIDEAILPDLEASTLRTLGLREGDIIRVTKAIKQKHPQKSSQNDAMQEQLRKDEQLARQLQAQESGPTPHRSSTTSPAPNLFAGPNGALKNQRRTRPTLEPRASSSLVDLPSIATAASQIRSGSPRVRSPDVISPTRVDSPVRKPTPTIVAGGFEDDAWAPRPSSTIGIKSNTPAPVAPTPPPAPPAPAPPTAPLVAPVAASVVSNPIAGHMQRPSTTTPAASSGSSGTFDLLAQIRQMRPPSAPIAAAPQHTPTPPMSSPLRTSPGYGAGLGVSNSPSPMAQLLTAQQTGAPPLQPATRGPFAPVPANQALLAPLIPTNTGFNSFVPTRPNISSQPTGFAANNSFSNGLQPQPTGAYSSFQPSPFMSQPTGFVGGMNSGLNNYGNTGFQPSNGFNNNPGLPLQTNGFHQQVPNGSSFDALSRPPASPPPGNNTSPASVFASMKAGNFANGAQSPQSSDKYDALRNPNGSQLLPQPTGWGGAPGNFGIQPQPTGFQPTGFQPTGPQMQGFPPQPTGVFNGFQNGSGYPQQQYGG